MQLADPVIALKMRMSTSAKYGDVLELLCRLACDQLDHRRKLA